MSRYLSLLLSMKLPKQLGADKPPHQLWRGDKNFGFTIFELLIVFGIFAILAAIGVPIGLNFYLSYQFDAEYELLISLLQNARNLAMVNRNESDHGLFLDTDEFVIFQGSSYSSRVASGDRSFPRASNISIGGLSEIVFSALSGNASASTTYSLSDGTIIRDLYINSEGLVYE